MQATGKNPRGSAAYRRFVILAAVAVAIAVVAFWRLGQAEITGPVAGTGQAAGPDGTVQHPFADVSQCPAHVDLVFWTSSRRDPNFPANLSVCFVGNQSFEKSAPYRADGRDR